jgi:S1-C subfamily serine protease
MGRKGMVGTDRGRSVLLLIMVLALGAFVLGCTGFSAVVGTPQETATAEPARTQHTAQAVPTLTVEPTPEVTSAKESSLQPEENLTGLYEQVNMGVVSIRVYVQQGTMTGQAAGSGFILDSDGHIVTNNHVVADAEVITVIFHNGFEERAQLVGADPDSDLAVIQVDQLADGWVSLPLAESSAVEPGEWVVAIGNPFALGGSMSLGIVSAVGRAIPSVTQFEIPQAIQTDAAINPGNSGGPLLNLNGEVVGVNAQIASAGTGANTGVGFAIPSDTVRRVVPALIQEGSYTWPWLGVSGLSVNLLVQQANDLSVQRGAYIAEVVSGGPADQAGLRGATGTETILGLDIPVGGDVVVEADGQPIADFTDLLAYVASKQPGDTVNLTILRDGQQQQVTVQLAARPENLGQ